MAERKSPVAVFPIPPMQGVWMAPDELRACLIKALENYA
jgi:hypothetical protein